MAGSPVPTKDPIIEGERNLLSRIWVRFFQDLIKDVASYAAHASRHLTGGSDEVDGDKLDIDWTPTNYTPSTSPSEANNADNLTAHLKGIDSLLDSHTHDGDTLQLDGITSDGGAFSFSTTGIVTFNRNAQIVANTIDTTATYTGLKISQIKTAGATDEADDFYGMQLDARMNDADSTIGHLYGLRFESRLQNGTIGDGQENVYGLWGGSRILAGTAGQHVLGASFVANIDGGTITNSIYGLHTDVDIESAVTSIGGNVYGIYLSVDADKDPAGTVIMVYLTEGTNIDYGIYQNGSADNYFGGRVGAGISSPVAQVHIDQSSTTAAIPVLYLDQADVSEEMMEFNTTIGTGNAIEAVGVKSLTTTHFIKVTLPGPLTCYIPCGTIA